MEYEVIDNFLTKEQHEEICESIVRNTTFPLYISNGVAKMNGDDGYYFTHLLYDLCQPSSDKFYLMRPLLEKISPFAIRRIKVNFYPSTPEMIMHQWHVDYEVPHKGAIYYLNTNNGKTILSDGTQIDSIANRMLFFDASLKHKSTTCTDDSHGRYNINFNYY